MILILILILSLYFCTGGWCPESELGESLFEGPNDGRGLAYLALVGAPLALLPVQAQVVGALALQVVHALALRVRPGDFLRGSAYTVQRTVKVRAWCYRPGRLFALARFSHVSSDTPT